LTFLERYKVSQFTLYELLGLPEGKSPGAMMLLRISYCIVLSVGKEKGLDDLTSYLREDASENLA
jgi:hypothetical protein